MKIVTVIGAMQLLLLFSMSRLCYAQSDHLDFEHLSPHRLPHTLVWSIYQDQEGFMWYGTYAGLVKYDGTTTTVWKTDSTYRDQSLQSNRIFDIHDDRQGNLWFPTEGGGLHELDKKTGQVKVYPIDSLQASRWDVAKSIFEDRQGRFWLSCGLGIALFDPTTKQYTLFPAPDEQMIDFLHQDNQGKLWGVNQEGLWQFDIKTSQYTLLPLLTASGSQLAANSLHIAAQGVAWVGTYGDGIFQVDTREERPVAVAYQLNVINKYINRHGLYATNDYLWVATNKGLQRINKKTDQIITYTADPSQPGSLSNDNIISIYKDRMGNLWTGMWLGVNKASLLPNTFYTHQVLPTPEPFHREENMITSILEDHTGLVWVVSAAGGLYQFNPFTNDFTHVVVNPEHSHQDSPKHWPLLEDKEDRLWMGGGYADKALYLYNRSAGTFTRYACEMAVNRLDMDITGRLWSSGLSEGIASFDPLTRKFTYYRPDEKDTANLLPGRVNDLLASLTGDIWISSTNGLSRFDPKKAQFTHYHPAYRTADAFIHDLWCLYEDAQGILWIGSREGGLSRFDPATATFTQFTTSHGLPGNRVNSIVGDAQGNLWIGTDNGLARFSPASSTFHNYGSSDGLPTIPYFSQNSAYSRKGRLLFGTYHGFVIFHPDSIKEKKAAPPPIYLTGFKVHEKSLPLPEEPIELSYDENFLSFEFVAINYDAMEKNQYAYRLHGFDADWIYSGTRRHASYTNLDPGDYIFEVKAFNNDGIWNEQGASLQLTILPPWWQTWWAYSLYAMLTLGLLYGLRQYTVNRERLRAELKLQKVEAEKMHEIDQLKSRFFANISHEFRTPLTLILGPLEKFIARTSAESSEDIAIYQMMHRNAQRLLHLINQLLDLSKLEAGNMKIEPKPADMVSFLKAIMLSFTSLAEKKQIQYQVQYPVEHLVVYFDADKVEKIITNLLSNAFKFTPVGGKITVSAQFTAAAKKALPNNFSQEDVPRIKILELKIQDNGSGIAEEQQEQIFDRFYQTETSHTRAQEGSGIGLSLVKELVELHEGEIAVESQPEKGSCFTVALPLKVAEYEQITVGVPAIAHDQSPMITTETTTNTAEDEAEAILTPVDIEAPLVLIVEDNADIRQFIQHHLFPAYQVIEACDGVEGYSKAVATIPDLILSDVMMPRMDGVTLCHKLKEDEKTAHVPVILLTARASGSDKIEGLETGADDYIIKPFEPAELLVRIKNLIESRKKLRERFSREITLEPASVAITPVDEQFLQKVMQIMEAHIEDATFGVEALGLEVGMSRMQLHRKLKALTDQSPGEFIRSFRLKRAAMLLAQNYGNVSEVAFRVGFQEPSYFAKCFREQFGQTPSEYLAGRAPTAKD